MRSIIYNIQDIEQIYQGNNYTMHRDSEVKKTKSF